MDIEIVCTPCVIDRENNLRDWECADEPFLLDFRRIFPDIGWLCDLLYCAGSMDEPCYSRRNGSGSLSYSVRVDMDNGKIGDAVRVFGRVYPFIAPHR